MADTILVPAVNQPETPTVETVKPFYKLATSA